MAKIHCHSLLSGSSWSSFGEDSPEEEAEAMEVDDNNGSGAVEATRLHREDMTLFGICPDQEEILLVVCRECGRVVKAAAFLRHCELNHQRVIPVPAPSPPEVVAKSSTVVETLLKSTPRKRKLLDSVITNEKIELMDATVKIEEMPLTVPYPNHSHSVRVVKTEPVINNVMSKKSSLEKPSMNKKSPRKQIPTREREFDADKHCGVWVPELQKQCTRSLTCKTHALSLRRAVSGRRKPFDELLAEHKARVNCEKEQQQNQALKLQEQAGQKALDATLKRSLSSSDASASSSSGSLLTSSQPIGRSISVEEDGHLANGVSKASSGSNITEDGTTVNGIMTLNHHPKPMTSCRFGSRSVGRGCFVFNRRSDHLRCAVLSMVERCLNPSLPRHKSNRASAAILQRPAMKTVGQASNQGLSSVIERYKGSANRSMNNFLKAPPPPRNKTLKQGSSGHSVNHVESVLNNSKSSMLQGTSLQNKKTYLDSIGTTSKGLASSVYVKPDASSQAISDMGNIVANIETNVSGGHPLNLGHTIGVTVTKGSLLPGPSLSVAGSTNLDSSLNLCSALGINSGNVQGSITTTQTSLVTNAASMMTVASGTQISGVSTVNGQIQPGFSNIKEILPAPIQGKVAAGSVASTSSSSPLFKGVQITAQVDPSTGKVVSTSAGQRVSPVFFKQATGTVQVTSIPNGTGPSPPPTGGTVKGFPLNFVIKGNTSSQGLTTSDAGVAASVGNPTNLSKGQNVIFNNIGISQLQHQSQLIVQQPPSPMSQNVHQRGKGGNSHAGNVHKGLQKSPSPSSQGQVVQANTLQQQKTVVVTSPQANQTKLFINHNNITSSQPIAQLKQQVEQQQQQLQQITFQKQIQQQQQQQLQQQKQSINSQFIKQLPIQPRLAPAPPTQSIISQHPLSGPNVLVKVTEQLKSPPNTVFVKTEPQQKIQHIVCQKPQSNVV